MAIPKERRNEIINEYTHHEGDIGSPEVQIVVSTEEINHLNEHAHVYKKDHHSCRGLMEKVGHHHNLLAHLCKTDVRCYHGLIKRLGLRR